MCIGLFHQYDGIILPRQQTATGLFNKVTKKFAEIAEYFTRSKASPGIKVPTHSETNELALVEHLSKKKEYLVKCDLTTIPKMNLMKCINNMYHIFEQLRNQPIVYGDVTQHANVVKWEAVMLDKVRK